MILFLSEGKYKTVTVRLRLYKTLAQITTDLY